MGEPTTERNRWRARPVVAAGIAAAVFVVPVATSIGTAALLTDLLPTTATAVVTALRWLAILGAATIVFIGCERLTRRALPLTVLLKLGMVFPGPAPRRLSVAKRTWTTRDLNRRIDEARSHGTSDEPSVAAEQILVLAATLSAHDRKTRGHAERVRAFTDLMAEELRLPADDRDRLRWSALLHDVGKLTVHSDILDKTGALSDDEWEMLCRHPLEGAKLTAPLATWLGAWANTIAEHHERFDGGGYPFGLAGKQISMGGRIVAVADSYDTMTSLRSCQEPMSSEAARLHLAAYAGTEFDPVMVRAFLAVPVTRLHAVAPLTWIGSLPLAKLGPQLARTAEVVGRVGVAAVAATACVVALVAGQRTVSATNPAQQSAPQRGVPHHSSGAAVPRPSTPGGGEGSSAPAAGAGGAGPLAATHPGLGDGAGSLVRHTGSQPTTSADAGSRSGSGSGSGQPSGEGTDGGRGPTTTVASGPPPSTPTTTVGGPPATPTTTSTTEPPAPPVAPSGLRAVSDCQALIARPEVSLSWVASPTSSVTGYVILRGPDSNSLSYEGTVSGRTTTSYTDTSVSGLGTTYWYKVEALAGGSLAASGPISVSTPSLCLSIHVRTR